MPQPGNTPPGFPVGNQRNGERGRDLPRQDRDQATPKGGDNPPDVEGFRVGGRR